MVYLYVYTHINGMSSSQNIIIRDMFSFETQKQKANNNNLTEILFFLRKPIFIIT